MIVVADTSPLNYLVLIGEIDLLPAIFGQVIVPRAVLQELQHRESSAMVRQWTANLPSWVEVKTAEKMMNPALMGLDPGEREAIELALELSIGTVLIDEADGREQAEKLHLEVRGTLGILERAAKLGMIDFRHALGNLERTNFRISPAIRAAFLQRNP